MEYNEKNKIKKDYINLDYSKLVSTRGGSYPIIIPNTAESLVDNISQNPNIYNRSYQISSLDMMRLGSEVEASMSKNPQEAEAAHETLSAPTTHFSVGLGVSFSNLRHLYRTEVII